MNNIETIKAGIKRFNKFIISAHINPEGDSIGSQIAMASLLKRIGKEVVIVNESPVPANLQFIKGREYIIKNVKDNFNFQSAVILDCPDIERIGNIAQYVSQDKVIINIDHHPSNKSFGKYNWIDSTVSSVGEMIFELFKSFELEIEYDEAVAIYVAIMTDTGSFRYRNTSSHTHRIVAKLVDKGVAPYEIYSKIYENTSFQDTRLLGEALQTLRLSDDGRIAWLWITKEMIKRTKASLEGTEGMVNLARSIGGVQIAILFRETGANDKIKVSFRSKEDVDVNKLASLFGGGGHKTASGCNMFGNKQEVENKVLDKAEEMVGM